MTDLQTQVLNKSVQRYSLGLILAWFVFQTLLDRVWQIGPVISFCLFVPLAGLLAYWLIPKPQPQKVSFAKYVGILLLAVCAGLILMGLLWGLLKLLSTFVSVGWAGAITFFVLVQSVYWVFCWLNPRNRTAISFTRSLIWSLLFASFPILLEYYFRSTLQSLTR